MLKVRGVDDHTQGRPFVLDPIEVLPLGRCGWCHGTGVVPGGPGVASAGHGLTVHGPSDRVEADVPCGRCAGTGLRGERLLATEHVLIDDHGRARPYRPGSDRRYPVASIDRALPGRRPGEAAHRRHRCP